MLFFRLTIVLAAATLASSFNIDDHAIRGLMVVRTNDAAKIFLRRSFPSPHYSPSKVIVS